MGSTDLEFLKDFFNACDLFLSDSDNLGELEQKLDIVGFSATMRAKYINPPLPADLHLHSNYSDGQLFPHQVAWMARLIGLQAAALVDHNSISGVKEFITTGKKIGLEVWAGTELATALPGCEILVYFPETQPFLEFLDSPAAEAFLTILARRQQNLHTIAIQAIEELNLLLKQLGKTNLITEAELAKWYSGVMPYYPGTLSVLFLERLSPEERDQFQVYNPRNVTTKFLTPVLRHMKEQTVIDKTDETLTLIKLLKQRDFMTLAVLAHPVEMLRTTGMSLKEIREFTRDLALNHGLDGIEVRNPRDGEKEVCQWMQLWNDVRQELALYGRDFFSFSFSSDFHILIPDENTGTFTLGYGLLNPDYPRGNLKQMNEWPDFRRQIFNSYPGICYKSSNG
jgi:hypothetical protein